MCIINEATALDVLLSLKVQQLVPDRLEYKLTATNWNTSTGQMLLLLHLVVVTILCGQQAGPRRYVSSGGG